MNFFDCCGYFYLAVFLTGVAVCDEGYCDAQDASCNSDQIQEKLRNKLVVAAIDFGTTYSGWAYQEKYMYHKDKLVITTSKWSHNNILSKKTPTTVLIQPDGKTLEEFGYKAETRYLELAAEEEHQNYYYFKRFKMMLFDKQDLNTETKLVDDKGLELPAITVFSLAIGFLKDNLMDALEKEGKNFKLKDIHWVLTVPAIWNDMAKQFMRKSAVAAGILNEDLSIALEPEAASLYCRLLPVERQEDGKGQAFINSFQPGRKYMVLDAGGGTTDITVHLLLSELRLKELYKATGGPWGGLEVDKAFEHMLTTLIGGEEIYQTFKEQCAYDHLDMLRGFEATKRSVQPGSAGKHVIRIPMCYTKVLEMSGETMESKIAASVYKEDIKVKHDKLIISSDLARSFFKEVAKNVAEHVAGLFERPELEGTDTLLMVGGFSESEMLRHAVRASLEGKNINIISPQDGELVIVKGAVLYGYEPHNVKERIAKYTYGIKTVRPFIKDAHDEKKCNKFLQKGVYKCDNLFSKFVEVDTPVRYGEIHGEQEFRPMTEEARNVSVFIYACTGRFPEYVTDEGCVGRTKVVLELHENNVPLEDRIITISFTFSDSEIIVTAREKLSGNKVETTLDFRGD